VKKLKLSPVLAAGMAAAVQIHQGQALANPQTVTYTTDTSYNTSTIDLIFSSDIANADELLSISGGTVGGGESGTFTLTVDYANSTHQQIVSQAFNGFHSILLASISNKTFTEGTIDGLTLAVTAAPGGTGVNKISLPSGTDFTFAVVPEPTSLALAGLGLGGMWMARRRADKQG